LNSDEPGFAAFRAKVFADNEVQQRLRSVVERDAFIALVVQLGRDNGFHFTAADVTAEMTRGHTASLMSWIPIL